MGLERNDAFEHHDACECGRAGVWENEKSDWKEDERLENFQRNKLWYKNSLNKTNTIKNNLKSYSKSKETTCRSKKKLYKIIT